MKYYKIQKVCLSIRYIFYVRMFCLNGVSKYSAIFVIILKNTALRRKSNKLQNHITLIFVCHIYHVTVCPRSSDPIYIISNYIKWVTTSWTASIYYCHAPVAPCLVSYNLSVYFPLPFCSLYRL